MSAESRGLASARICEEVAALPAWRQARVVGAFVPLATEPQIQPLWREKSDRVFCFPRVSGAEIALLRIDDRAGLDGAGWRLDAPEFAACAHVAPGDLDAILVPGLAFTRDGCRLGHGGGYYDRLLAQCAPRTAKIGVCFATQMFDALPSEPHDVRVDAVVCATLPPP